MALRDVKKYYYTMLGQYVDLKEDLADFEQGFKDGYVTEDRLAEVKEEYERLKENADRLAYIMYLFELPNRTAKQQKFNKANADVLNYFSQANADKAAVELENKNITAQIRAELTRLTEGKQD